MRGIVRVLKKKYDFFLFGSLFMICRVCCNFSVKFVIWIFLLIGRIVTVVKLLTEVWFLIIGFIL